MSKKYIELAKTLEFITSVGDIHGKYPELGFAIKERYKIRDSIILGCGDIGLGFHKFGYYIDEFTKLNKILQSTNNVLFLVRGNHDDPDYFNGELSEKIDQFSNLKLVPDYYTLETSKGNILFVGGGTSIDRTYREVGKTYWFGEQVIWDEDKINSLDKKIDIVATHSAPAFAYPQTKYGLIEWLLHDPGLDEECDIERGNLTKVYNKLIENGHQLKYWCYGHFHMSHRCNHDDTKFILNPELSFYELTF